MPLRRLNLNKKVLLTLLAVGLVPAAAGVALTARQLWTAIRDVSGDHLLTEARNIAVSLDREINNFINEAALTVATASTVGLFSSADFTASPDRASDDMATSLTAIAETLWVELSTSRPLHLVTSQGVLYPFIIEPEGGAVQPNNRPVYRALEARFAETRRQFVQPALKPVMVYTDPTLRRPVALAWVPVFRRNTASPLGWFGLEIPVAKMLVSDVSRTLLDVDETCVVTREGHLLGQLRFRPDRISKLRERLSLSRPGTPYKFEVHYDDGGSHLVGSTPLPTLAGRATGVTKGDISGPPSDWYVCVARDLHPLAWDFRWRIARYLLAATALALILALVASFLAGRITRPVQQLEQGVRRLAEGDLSSRVEVATGDELESLAREFNKMADQIQQSALDIQSQMDTVRRQANELALLHETSRAINARLDLDQTLATFARETARLISYDHISVALLDDDGQHCTVQFVFPEMEASEFAPGTRHSLDDSYVGEVVATGRPVVRQDITQPVSGGQKPVDEFLASAGLRSVLYVPLISESKAIGSVNLASRAANAFTTEEQERMVRLAEGLAVAIQHGRLYMRVRRFAEELEGEVRRRTAQLRMAQDKLVQTERLAAAGQLAVGIAHEINNPLGIIKNCLRLAMDRMARLPDSSPTAKQNLQIVEEEINRIARIVRNLLDLYHPRDETPVQTDLHDLLVRVFELFAPKWDKMGIRLVRRFAPALPPVTVLPDRIRQVFINLFRNAEDAMPEGGTLTLTTHLDPPSAEHDDERIVIEVEDTGCGIPPEALARVFDPFFTTKKGGAGTGLGLSVSYGIVRSCGGTIDIDSEVGRGARVTVTLPVVGATALSAEL